MWRVICVLSTCALSIQNALSLNINPSRSIFYRAEGSTLEVDCEDPGSVNWTSSRTIPANALKGSSNGNNNIITLKLENISTSNEGTYSCQAGKDGPISFELIVLKVAITQNVTFEYKVNTMLHCQSTDWPSTLKSISWKKGEVNVGEIPVEGKQEFKVHTNGSLEIIQPARSFAGVYTCYANFTVGSGEIQDKMGDVTYYASPKVLPFDKSKNLVQGEDLAVVCQVLGYPKPVITWMKGSTILGGSDSTRITLEASNSYDGQSIDNAKLTIKEVNFDDAGEYNCIAKQRMWENFNSSQIVLVRVKDKLAALWPFLGIVAEVVVLCTIIVVYEKKRNKDTVIDEDDEQQGNATAKHDDTVRHRGNTNNPRA